MASSPSATRSTQTRGKTKTARRTIELDATTIAVLEGWRSLQTAGLAAVGIANDEGWVFTDGEGNTIHPHAVYESFKRIVRNAGVPAMRFHDLRHTHGSLLLKEGIPVKVVSERLGHAHIAHTLQTYQHVLPGMQAAAADAAERITKPRPTLNKPGSNADPAAPPKRRSDAKKPTGNDPGERRGNNRRKACRAEPA